MWRVYHLESDLYKRPVSMKTPIKCDSSAKDIQHGFRDIIQKSSALEHLGPWGHRIWFICLIMHTRGERWGAGVETQNNVRGEIGGWGRVPFNETYAPLLSTIYDGAWGSLNFLKMGLDPSPPPLYVRHVSFICVISAIIWFISAWKASWSAAGVEPAYWKPAYIEPGPLIVVQIQNDI